jgi:hypothetical protein
MIRQVPVTGTVQYKKAVYQTAENRPINVHFFGDRHNRFTKCIDDAIDTTSLFVSSLTQSHKEIDVFVEIGLGFDIREKKETNYLNGLIKHFQEKYRCLLKGRENKTECHSTFPNVRFHNIDFRSTLYYEYMQVIDYWYNIAKDGKDCLKIDKLTHDLIDYAKNLATYSILPYPFTGEKIEKDREIHRLSWVYDMIVARDNRLDGKHKRRVPFACNLNDFLLDFYYLICCSVPKSPIHDFFPRYLSINTPYYLIRLAHEYRSIPEVQNSSYIQMRFDTVLKDQLEMIRSSSTPKKIKKEMTNHLYIKHIEQLSWFMDMYLCFRLLKPYISNSVVLVGVSHIQQIEKIMENLGINVKTSPTFQNINDAQCISIPLSTTEESKEILSFDDNLFLDIIPDNPAYTYAFHTRNRKKSKHSKKRSHK